MTTRNKKMSLDEIRVLAENSSSDLSVSYEGLVDTESGEVFDMGMPATETFLASARSIVLGLLDRIDNIVSTFDVNP